MASALAIQLERLKAAATPSAPAVRGKPSLLFSYQDAADIDVDTIYHLGLAGLQDLASRDSRFRVFESSLFSRDLLSQNREHHNKEWNAQVSAVISGFLQLLSNYFLQPSAFKTLEYLIRKFKVNELEVHELLLCALPYHTTNEFVRLVQVLALKNTPWEFLGKVQSNGVALPRVNLVHRCLKHQEVLKSICEGALTAARPDVANRTYLSFFAVTVCETLQAMGKVKEDTVAMLLPYMLAGLQKGIAADLKGASIMIFSQLAAKAPLGLKLLAKLITQLAKGAEPRGARVVALVLAQMASSQPHLTQLPAKALKAALKLPGFDQELASIARNGTSSSLLRLVTSSLCSALAQHPSLGAHLLSILHATTLPADIVESLASRLLRDGASCSHATATAAGTQEGPDDSAAGKEVLLRALRLLEQRYPEEVDAATNKLLGQAPAPSGPQAPDQDPAQDEQDEEPADGALSTWQAGIMSFVKEAFHGGMHRPLSEEAGSITLARAASAPAASVRAMAVQQIGELLETTELSAASRSSAEALLIERLGDDDWSVVKAVLQLKALPSVGPAGLVSALTALLRRAEAAVAEPAAASAGIKAISVLASLLNADNLVAVASALVPYLLLTPDLHRLCFAALRALSGCPHPLFAHLEAPLDNTKRPKKVPTGITFAVADDDGVITATIQALSKAIADAPTLAPVAQLALATSHNGRHVLLLALAHTCSTTPFAHPAAMAIIDIVRATWPQCAASLPIPTDPSDTWVAQATSIFTPTCLPLATYIPMLHNSLPHLHAVVQLRALHAAVSLLAPNPADSLFSSTFDTLTHLRPPEPFYPHLEALANKLPATTSVPFLAQHMVTAPDATPAATIAHILSTLVPRPEVSMESLKALLPNVLTALSSDHRPLRIGALHLAVAARDRLLQPPPTGPAGSAPLLGEFLDSLLAHGELIKNDGASLALLVNNTLCPHKATGTADPSPRLPTITLPTSAAAINAAWSFLTACLSSLSGRAASANVLCLLSCLSNAADPAPVLKASLPQLKRIISAPAASLTSSDIQLAGTILGLVTPTAHSQVPAFIPLLLALVTAPPTPALRVVAFTALSAELFSSLSAPKQGDVLQVLLSTSAVDPDADCRSAARACLEVAPVSAAAVSHLLAVQAAAAASSHAVQCQQGVTTPNKKNKQAAAPSPSHDVDASLTQSIKALEMLQWKAPLPAPSSQLLAALQGLVSSLLPSITSIAVPHSEVENGPASPATPDSGSLAGYAVQLALMAIKRVLEEGDASAPGAVDLGVVVACAQQAPDYVVRNAALLVVAAMAASRPESTLDHVLQVMAVVNKAAVMQADAYNTRIATATMTAVVPAWVKAGRSTSELWRAVVSSLGAVPASRRLALLCTLKEVLPEDEGVHVALLHLLRMAAPSAEPQSPATAPSEVDDATWAPEVAALLSLQVPPASRLRAFSRLLSASLDGSRPEEALPRTVVAFVGAQLQVKSLLVASRKLLVSSSEGVTPQMAELQAGGEGLMNSALAQLQVEGTWMAPEGAPYSRALQAAAGGLHSLIKALEGVLPSAHYIQALVQLQGPHSTDACRRRTLRLLASKIGGIQQEAEDLAVLAPTKKQARITAITDAAMELLPNLPFLLDPSSSSPTTRQAALLAIDALVLQFGTSSPSTITIAATLPPIITTCSDVLPAVRASALTSVATVIRALGHKVVAHVPSAVRAILAAANTSAEAIADSSAQPEGSEQSTAQQQSYVLAAALAALLALVEHTAALMSPYIGAVLQLLLRPEVLECTSPHCSTFSTRLRHSLPASLSPRVLLGPLHDQLGPALEAGAKPATALLEICTAAASAMDSRSAAAYHEKLFSLFLTALEVRQTQPPSLLQGNGIYEVESEAVRGVVALVMKLSEANFKPMFLALMEWTNEAAEPTAGAAATPVPSDNMGRICAMMSLVEALAHRLRSVFVPYFRYLLDVCVHFLTTGAGLDSRALKRLKKKRRESLAAEENGGSAPVSAVDLVTSWVLRAKIVRSLHRCFLYDSVAFLDHDRFNRLLHPLVAQLDAEPPGEVVAALEAQCGDAELDGCLESTASLDLMGRAVVGCLAVMATSAGSDALWKPLNQQVLMTTRSMSSRTRLLGLEVSSQLIGRLREEFLVLLPESIPFLAELLEDSDVVVERRTQEVVKLLEELSGEKLDEYMK